jgi:hypothetical protein
VIFLFLCISYHYPVCLAQAFETPTWQLHRVFNENFAAKYGCRTLTKQGFNEALGKEGYETYNKEWSAGADRHHQVFVCGIGLKPEYEAQHGDNSGAPNQIIQ